MQLVARNSVSMVSAAALVAALVALPQQAEARRGRGVGVGIAVGVIGAFAIAAAAKQARAKSERRAKATRPSRPRATAPVTSSKPDDEEDTVEFSSAILDVQRALKDLGYYSGDVDGYVGDMTRTAVRAYQRDMGMPPSGTLSEPARRDLMRRVAAVIPGTPPGPVAAVAPLPSLPPPATASVRPDATGTMPTAVAPLPGTPTLGTRVVPGATVAPSTGVLPGSVELTSEQIKTAIGGWTFSGTEATTGARVRIYFESLGTDAPHGALTMRVAKSSGDWQTSEGLWFVELEASLLCMRLVSGPEGKACWRVHRGASLEFIRAAEDPSTKSLTAAPGSLSFDKQERGNVTASAS